MHEILGTLKYRDLVSVEDWWSTRHTDEKVRLLKQNGFTDEGITAMAYGLSSNIFDWPVECVAIVWMLWQNEKRF